MPQQLVLLVVQFGFLALLWLFVLVAVRVVRTDLFGPRASRARLGPVAFAPSARAERRAPRPRSQARRLVVT
ncbi:MAG TPA: hypothetical protein VFJ14_00775, partial [Nocardioidaceae bacterium]|nr:hypothetical protein [Nocardioidaceae bacterium]